MRLKYVAYVLALIGVLAVSYGQWQRAMHPPRVIKTASFQFTDKAGTTLIFPQRVVAVAGFETTEVQLPHGTWIDCRGDCAATIKAEHTEFWDHQILQRR
jgi:hypothetical protein